jgi:VIT1/CCC1 family predicted Fe2+/Mn2+ transporter
MHSLSQIFTPYSIPPSTIASLTTSLTSSPHLVDFLMKFSHCLESPAASRAFTSAFTIALAYFLGGLLPLIPYFFVGTEDVYQGLYISIGVMVLALFAFGYAKTCAVVGWEGHRNVRDGCWGGVQMVFVGSVAAGAAMGLVRVFNGEGGM